MKKIRTGVYALLKFQGKIITIKKTRGPFTGMLDMPGGKIEHFENHKESLKREIYEETGIDNIAINKLFAVEEYFIHHVYNGENLEEHGIGIVYLVDVISGDIDMSFIEKGGDAGGLVLIDIHDTTYAKTPIFTKILSLL